MISLPIIYMAFGVCSEGDYVILKEFLYGLPWIIAGILVLAYDFKYSTYVVGILWVVHGGYDLYHNYLFINSGSLVVVSSAL